MKRFLLIIILTLSFQTLTKADDAKDVTWIAYSKTPDYHYGFSAKKLVKVKSENDQVIAFNEVVNIALGKCTNQHVNGVYNQNCKIVSIKYMETNDESKNQKLTTYEISPFRFDDESGIDTTKIKVGWNGMVLNEEDFIKIE